MMPYPTHTYDLAVHNFTLPIPNLAEFMTVQEAALKLGFHVNPVRRMRRQGDFPGVKIGATWPIAKESVQKH